MSNKPLGVGVVGLGFMGFTHIRAYLAAAEAGFACKLLAVSDPNPARLSGEPPPSGNMAPTSSDRVFDPKLVRGYLAAEDLFADPSIDVVSICTYTDTHVELALKALAASKHVLVEKPVALHVSDVRDLEHAATRANRLCMPAMCMRFWPGWDFLHTHLLNKTFGPLRSASFTRLGSGPGWANSFYKDEARSGGALFDLHIHDADFIYWCLGIPERVFSTGSTNHTTTSYQFDNGPSHLTAQGAWALAPSAGFRMQYLVNFEHASIEFDLAKTPTVTIHHADRSEPVIFPALSGYEMEIRHFLDAVQGKEPLRATLADAANVVAILNAERQSLLTHQPASPADFL